MEKIHSANYRYIFFIYLEMWPTQHPLAAAESDPLIEKREELKDTAADLGFLNVFCALRVLKRTTR